jgi:glycosyltransferase involved in cell wall biosynthesis
MDALRRGCVALTTRVGQTDELVEDGGNGFFCTTEEEFATRLAQLAADPALLLRMRRRALELAGRPVEETIRAQLRSFLP